MPRDQQASKGSKHLARVIDPGQQEGLCFCYVTEVGKIVLGNQVSTGKSLDAAVLIT